jgi:hypothetical protein
MIAWFPGTEGTHFAGLPVTDGKWVEDRDSRGVLHGWLEMFSDAKGRWFSIPDASRYIKAVQEEGIF